MEIQDARDWPGSFERDTLVHELGQLATRLLRSATLPLCPVAPQVDDLSRENGRPLIEFSFATDAHVALHQVEAYRFVVHVRHPQFEVVVQVVVSGPNRELDALRVASLRGDPMTALVWCRLLTSKRRQPHTPPPTRLDMADNPKTKLEG